GKNGQKAGHQYETHDNEQYGAPAQHMFERYASGDMGGLVTCVSCTDKGQPDQCEMIQIVGPGVVDGQRTQRNAEQDGCCQNQCRDTGNHTRRPTDPSRCGGRPGKYRVGHVAVIKSWTGQNGNPLLALIVDTEVVENLLASIAGLFQVVLDGQFPGCLFPGCKRITLRLYDFVAVLFQQRDIILEFLVDLGDGIAFGAGHGLFDNV